MKKENQPGFRFLLVTDRLNCPGNFLETVMEVVLAGVEAVQLREKDLPGGPLFQLAKQVKELAQVRNIPLIINDRIDVAMAISCQGVHLGSNSFPPLQLRKILGPSFIVGQSTHSINEALSAEKNMVDYVMFGPIFPTPSKLKYGPPQGVERLNQLCKVVSTPVIAIGGINLSNIEQVMDAGAWGVGVISAIFQAENIPLTVAKFKETLAKYN